MSFYGQVLYEFKKLFSQLQIKNNKDNREFEKELEEKETNLLEPDCNWDTLEVIAGNRWIGLKGNTVNDTLTIYHNEPDEDIDNTTEISYFGLDKDGETYPIGDQLKFGQELVFNTALQDKAGHLKASEENQTTKLPNLTISLFNTNKDIEEKEVVFNKTEDNNLKFSANEMIKLIKSTDNDGFSIEHKLNPDLDNDDGSISIYEDEIYGIKVLSDKEIKELFEVDTNGSLQGVTSLATNNIIRVPTIKYDKAGHGVVCSWGYYSMPVSETNKDIGSLKTGMAALTTYTGATIPLPDGFTADNSLDKRLITLDKELSTHIEKYNDWTADVDGKQRDFKTLAGEVDTNTTTIGDKKMVFDNDNNYTTLISNESLSDAIGNLANLSSAIGKLKPGKEVEIKVDSLSNLLIDLCENVLATYAVDIAENDSHFDNLSLLVANLNNEVFDTKDKDGTIINVGLKTKVANNTDAINILNGTVGVKGSVADSINVLENNVNKSLATLIDEDEKINTVLYGDNNNGLISEVKTNTANIAILNSDVNTEGSVYWKINEKTSELVNTVGDKDNGLVKQVNDNSASISILQDDLNVSKENTFAYNMNNRLSKIENMTNGDQTTLASIITNFEERISALENSTS